MSNENRVEILLVEDNPRDAELTIRTLKRHNLTNRLVHVKDGEEALEFLMGSGRYSDRKSPEHPRVIMLDLKLPKVDGLEVLKTLREHPQMRYVPVVVLTSSHEESDLIKSYELGVNSYIVKPVDFDGFSAAVAEAGHYWILVNKNPA